jgi:hypothetical protein
MTDPTKEKQNKETFAVAGQRACDVTDATDAAARIAA